MQITLNQDEILAALESYVRSQITVAEDQTIVFDLKAGRGEHGFSATLDIVPANVKSKPKGIGKNKAEKPATTTKPRPVAEVTSEPDDNDAGPIEVAEEPDGPEEQEEEPIAAEAVVPKVSIFGKSA